MYTPTLSSLNAYIQSWPLRAGVGWHRSCSLLLRWHLGFYPPTVSQRNKEAGWLTGEWFSFTGTGTERECEAKLSPANHYNKSLLCSPESGWLSKKTIELLLFLGFLFLCSPFQPNRSVVRSNELKSVQSANLFGRKRDTWTTLLFAIAVSTQHFSCKTSANLLVVEHSSRTGNEWRWDDEKGVLFCFDGVTYWVEVDRELGVIEHDCGNWKHLQIPFGVDKNTEGPRDVVNGTGD